MRNHGASHRQKQRRHDCRVLVGIGSRWLHHLGRDVGVDSNLPREGSLSQFITEHYWGYAARQGGGHPRVPGRTPAMECERHRESIPAEMVEKYFGPEFAKVLEKAPDAMHFLSKGSPSALPPRGSAVGVSGEARGLTSCFRAAFAVSTEIRCLGLIAPERLKRE